MSQRESFLELVRARRSIRKFREDPIPQETLHSLIEAASWAPSASNRQDWEFTVITSENVKEEMKKLVWSRWESLLRREKEDAVTEGLRSYLKNFDWFAQAPVLIVISAKRPEAFLCNMFGDAAEGIAGTSVSAAMAAENLMLAAHASGVGSCCVTGPLAAEEELKGLLGMGKRRRIVCLIALGYPAEQPAAPGRKPVERIAKYIE